MSPPRFRRLRARSRSLGAALAFSFLFAQTALALHHHDLRVSGRRAAVSRRDELGDGVDCLVCALTAHVQAAAGTIPAVASAAAFVCDVPAAVRIAPGGPSVLRPSCRAPPAA